MHCTAQPVYPTTTHSFLWEEFIHPSGLRKASIRTPSSITFPRATPGLKCHLSWRVQDIMLLHSLWIGVFFHLVNSCVCCRMDLIKYWFNVIEYLKNTAESNYLSDYRPNADLRRRTFYKILLRDGHRKFFFALALLALIQANSAGVNVICN